jgi:hypothetical protein
LEPVQNVLVVIDIAANAKRENLRVIDGRKVLIAGYNKILGRQVSVGYSSTEKPKKPNGGGGEGSTPPLKD